MKTIEIFGRNSVNKLKWVLSNWKISKILLATGKRSYDTSIIKEKIEANLHGYEVLRYCEFENNPKYNDILNGLKLVSEYKPDIILGVGGGSVIDTAKLLSTLPYSENKIDDICIGTESIRSRKIKLGLIPTMAGSGSEATHFAVLYKNNIKYSIASENLLSDFVILDSGLTITSSKELTAIGLFDVFCQSIESFWSVGATKESIKYATQSIEIILKIYERILTNPTEMDREMMMIASFNAGKAINISKTTGPHAVSYTLTHHHNIPHGKAVMLTMPIFFEINTNSSDKNINTNLNIDEYKRRIDQLFKLLKITNSHEGVEIIHKMLDMAGVKIGLHNYGINQNDHLNTIVDDINVERLKNNPMLLDRDRIKSIIEFAI